MNQSERLDDLAQSGWRQYHRFSNGWIVMWRISRDYAPLSDYLTVFKNGRIAGGIVRPKNNATITGLSIELHG